MNDLIYGKSKQENIVGIDLKGTTLYKYIAEGDKTRCEKAVFQPYMLLNKYDPDRNCGRLEGDNHYKYYTKFKDKKEMWEYKRQCDYRDRDYWRCYNDIESYMITKGDTMYKGMKMSDTSILSFDIETTGVKIDNNSYVLLISNTFRDRSGNIKRRMFSFDEYSKPAEFLSAWCKWVRECNPDIMLGHNIMGFDIPYLMQFARNYNTTLNLGRDGSNLSIDSYIRKFRKDGSQQYEYNNAHVFGRELIDTYFLSFKYDVQRKYESYGLKQIIKQEKLEKPGRQFWDFEKNKEPWNNVQHWKEFKQYAEEDADDALALYDLMAPQFFYYTQSIPKNFQEVINTATGSQVNGFMMRSYLQRGQSVPKACEKTAFEGAISIGNPGIYQNVYKVDVASLYPSIMLTYNVTNNKKDPDGMFLKAVKYFTEERLRNKALGDKKDPAKRYWYDLEQGQKIMINSFYGFMGAPGLNFNYPEGAAEVTRHGRRILIDAIEWATGEKYND